MPIKLRLFIICFVLIPPTNVLINYLEINTEIPYPLLNIFFSGLICWLIVDLAVKYFCARLKVIGQIRSDDLDSILAKIAQVNHDLSVTNHTLDLVLDNCAQAMVVLDCNFKATKANPIAIKIFGKGIDLSPINFAELLPKLAGSESSPVLVHLHSDSYRFKIITNLYLGETNGYILTADQPVVAPPPSPTAISLAQLVNHDIRTCATALLNVSETLAAETQPTSKVFSEFLPVFYRQSRKLVKLIDAAHPKEKSHDY